MTQSPLDFTLRDPNIRKQDVKRLTGQCLRVLDALTSGPKTNMELSALALKYTAA
jgi:hypothetical protein